MAGGEACSLGRPGQPEQKLSIYFKSNPVIDAIVTPTTSGPATTRKNWQRKLWLRRQVNWVSHQGGRPSHCRADVPSRGDLGRFGLGWGPLLSTVSSLQSIHSMPASWQWRYGSHSVTQPLLPTGLSGNRGNLAGRLFDGRYFLGRQQRYITLARNVQASNADEHGHQCYVHVSGRHHRHGTWQRASAKRSMRCLAMAANLGAASLRVASA